MDEQQFQPDRTGRPAGYVPDGTSSVPPTQPQQPTQPQEPLPVNQMGVDLEFVPSYVANSGTMSESDRNLRLAAFIFMVIGIISTCWAVIPLAWTIPMTVISWKIYKGERPNTTAFGVLSLIFVSLVAGILLLISTKDN